MSESNMSSIISHIVSDRRFHSKLIELYFLVSDSELGDLTWKIASLSPEKRSLIAQLVHTLQDAQRPAAVIGSQ